MKKHFAFLILAGFAFTACNVKVKTDDQIQDQINRDKEARLKATHVGGSPGQIVVKGAGLKKTASNDLDSKIVLESIGGMGSMGNSRLQVSQPARSVLPSDADSRILSKISSSGTFINLGCDFINPSLTSGLTETVPDRSNGITTSVYAQKIFLCGKTLLPGMMVMFRADELILTDADVSIRGSLGNIDLITNKLILEGKNRISGLGVNFSGLFGIGPSIDLSVDQEMTGDGSLLLQTVGGDNIP